jgi:hypothetical protein
MLSTIRLIPAVLSLGLSSVCAQAPAKADGELAWPAVTRQMRPWAYWWWMGSAADKSNLRRELQRYQDAGMGGLHIVPIYGAKGWEKHKVEYLSPAWMELLAFTIAEADQRDLGVDMTLGTGWCFGGPQIGDLEANASVLAKTQAVPPGKPEGKWDWDRQATQALVAFSPDGRCVELTDRIRPDGSLDWTAEGAGWKLVSVGQRPSGVRVKRAAPGGEGHMLNPFFGEAIRRYLVRFTQAFDSYRGPLPRAFYHDSFEYGSNWSPDLFEQFESRRGYRLQQHLDKFFSNEADEVTARLKCDYRETISDMMVEGFMPAWVGWAHQRGARTRDQAHGSPGNLLDLYAVADIPETEMFNRDRDPLVSRFASSAAHVAGRQLVGAETGTWLKEHFTETLADMKRLVDELLVTGVNHIFYHGTCYSPDEAIWPGWLFYASTQMNPRNSIWRDVPALNAYIARCQAVLQSGHPDNDVLVYWPIHDFWHDPAGLTANMTVHGRDWLDKRRIGPLARRLWERGFAFDFVSDRQIAGAQAAEGMVKVPGSRYRVLVLPQCRYLPVDTLKKVLSLAEDGAAVLLEDLPQDVPGLARLQERRLQQKGLLARLQFPEQSGVRKCLLGRGQVLLGDIEAGLETAGIQRELLVDTAGLTFVRRKWESGRHYFLANHGGRVLDRWVPLADTSAVVAAMDPMNGAVGLCATRPGADGQTEVYLQLRPDQSVILRTFNRSGVKGPAWPYWKPVGEPLQLEGTWKLSFISGGPELPQWFETGRLGSWTRQADPAAQRFAGTARYTLSFEASTRSRYCWLDLGRVCQSARVRLNGRDLGSLIAPPFRVLVDNLQQKGNELEVEVTNVAANRIRDLDRRGVPWRNFEDINFVNIEYKPFDASGWPLTDSGLLGPVTLQSVEPFQSASAK